MNNLIRNIFIVLFTLTIQAVTVSAQTNGITVAWDANDPAEEVSEYRLYYKIGAFGPPYNGTGLNKGPSPITIPVGTLTDRNNPKLDLSGFKPGVTYRFALTAYNGNESRYSVEALYNSPALELDRIAIEGPGNIQEKSITQYNLRAYFTNNTDSQVNASSWTVNCPEAGIANDGLLSVGAISADLQCTLNAGYSSGGATQTTRLNIAVKNTDDATLDRIEIIGPNEVNENTNTAYVCRAYFSDGTFLNIIPTTWSITTGTSLADITSWGVLNTHEVDTQGTVRIKASFTNGQTTRSDVIQVAVKDANTPTSGSTNTINQDFEGFASNENPSDWLDTQVNNSMVVGDNLFKVFNKSGEKVFGTSSTASDIHSHYIGAGIDTLSAYEYSGRMMMTASNSGIGVTFFSQYPNKDAYYRLRRYGNSAFHIAPHPHGVSKVYGDTNTGVVPSPNVWYWFRILVEDTGSRTKIRAKVWSENSKEPAGWQVDCYDSSSTRLTSGVVGVWSYSSGAKYWDDISICADSTCNISTVTHPDPGMTPSSKSISNIIKLLLLNDE